MPNLLFEHVQQVFLFPVFSCFPSTHSTQGESLNFINGWKRVGTHENIVLEQERNSQEDKVENEHDES